LPNIALTISRKGKNLLLIAYAGKKPQIGPNVFIAPTATLIGDVVVGEGSSIWFGAVLRGDLGRIIIGKGTSIQDNVVVHVMPDCETVIGDNVTVAHGAVLHGCLIKEGAIIGMGAVLQDFCEIGAQAMVAAGSVVTDGTRIPDRHLAAGAPATVRKEIDGTSLMWVASSAAAYRELAQSYLEQGIGEGL